MQISRNLSTFKVHLFIHESLTAWEEKLLCTLVLRQQILLYLLSDGNKVNRPWLRWLLSSLLSFDTYTFRQGNNYMNSIPSPIENLLDVPILSSSCGVQTSDSWWSAPVQHIVRPNETTWDGKLVCLATCEMVSGLVYRWLVNNLMQSYIVAAGQ